MRNGRLAIFEGWDLANAAAWDPVRWTVVANAIGINVQSGGGRMTPNGVGAGFTEYGGADAGRVITGNGDFELLVDVTFSDVTSSLYAEIYLGDVHQLGGIATNGVGLGLGPGATAVIVTRRDAFTGTDITSGAFTFTNNVAARVRWRREGPQVLVKVWAPFTTVEPNAWTATIAEYAYRGPSYGVVMLGAIVTGAATASTVTFDNLSVVELESGRRRTHVASTPASANLGTATATVTANNLTVGGLTLGTATVSTSAVGPDDALTAGTATATVTANNLTGVARTLGTATTSVTANNLTVGGTPLGTATVSTVANGLADALRLGTATAAVTASNLGTGSTSPVGSAAVGVTANNLTLNATANLGTATVTTTANGPGSALTTTAATTAFVANPAGTGHTPVVATATTTANPLTQTRTAGLGTATVSLTANNVGGNTQANLLFDSSRTGNWELFRLTANGTVTQLTSNAAYDSWWPRLSPDGRKILFVRSPAGVHDTDYTQVTTWTCDPDGSNIVNILAAGVDSWSLQGHPAWKPDGTKIVTMGGLIELYQCNPDGSSRVKLTTTGQANNHTDPQYSPDGLTVVYCFAGNVFRVSSAGGTPTQLTSDANTDYDPVVSPDGTTLAYLTHTSGAPASDWDIRLQDFPAGTNDRELIGDGAINSRPEWAANNASIYFHRGPSGGGAFLLYNITVPGAVKTSIFTGASADAEYPALLSLVLANLGTATSTVTANKLSAADTVGTATATTTAYNLTAVARVATAAAVSVTATAVADTDRTAGTATVGVTANPLAYTDAVTASAATVTVTANPVAPSGRTETTATATTTAYGLSAGATIAAANLALLASNLGYIATPTVTAATAAFTANNLSLTPTSTLGSALVAVTANGLAVAATQQAAVTALTAAPLGSARSESPANASLTAFPLAQARTAAPATATVTTTAYDLANVAPGTALLGDAAATVTANPLGPFTLASALSATVAFTTNPLVGPDRTEVVSTVTTTANPLTNTRQTGTATVTVTGYGLGLATQPAGTTATATFTAFDLFALGGTIVRFRGGVAANVRSTVIQADVRSPNQIMATRVPVHV